MEFEVQGFRGGFPVSVEGSGNWGFAGEALRVPRPLRGAEAQLPATASAYAYMEMFYVCQRVSTWGWYVGD